MGTATVKAWMNREREASPGHESMTRADTMLPEGCGLPVDALIIDLARSRFPKVYICVPPPGEMTVG